MPALWFWVLPLQWGARMPQVYQLREDRAKSRPGGVYSLPLPSRASYAAVCQTREGKMRSGMKGVSGWDWEERRKRALIVL